MKSFLRLSCLLLVSGALWVGDVWSAQLTVQSGVVNAVRVGEGEQGVWIYDCPSGAAAKARTLLLTHARRDVLPLDPPRFSDWDVVAPEAARDLLENPLAFWEAFREKRFHDYAQQSTKILGEPFPVRRWVKDGDEFEQGGTRFKVVATPGYTRGAVSYIARIDGKRTAFTGDLILAGGQILDLYSFQDAIPEAQIRGYHGYAARFADLVRSLQRLKEMNIDLIVPARGDVIHNPNEAIDQLIQRVQGVYRNYLSTNALNWYFKEDRMRLSGRRVLGEGAEIQLMSYSTHLPTPEWILTQSTSRLIVSDDGYGWLLDCGGRQVLATLETWLEQGVIRGIEGIFVTHYHDDHTDYVQAAAERFQCPVYALTAYEDVLERPGAYHLPAMTANAIADVQGVPDRYQMRWRGFEFTFYFYPGQAYYHGALLVEKPGEDPIFFIGDSFSPSGMDDYCLLNRNLVDDASGYFLCLKTLRDMDSGYWLINEHIPHIFRFSDLELGYLETRYRERQAMIAELLPWDAPNYGVDEQWAVFYPYGADVSTGGTVDLEVRLHNHSPEARQFTIRPRAGKGMSVVPEVFTVTLGAQGSGAARFRVQAPERPGVYLVTADVASDGMQFRNWVEALLEVK